MRVNVLLAGLCVLLVSAGCDRADHDAGSQHAASEAGRGGDIGVAAGSAAGAGLLVSVLPEPSTADGCLKALVGWGAPVTLRWQVNGQETPGQDDNQLCEGFRRGDVITVTASDGKVTASKTVTIVNAPPRLTEVVVNADEVVRHAALAIRPTVFDADGDPVELRFQWYVNGEADPFLTADTLPAGRYVKGDSLSFTIVPSDGSDDGALYRSDTLVVPNAPPVIVSQPPREFAALEYRYQVEASDPDGDRLVYQLREAPQGMTIGPAGMITWPLVGVGAGSYQVKIVVNDPESVEAFQTFTVALGAPAPETGEKP